MKEKIELLANELRIGSIVKCRVSNDAGIYSVVALPQWTIEQSRPVVINRAGIETHGIDRLKPCSIKIELLELYGFTASKNRDWAFIQYDEKHVRHLMVNLPDCYVTLIHQDLFDKTKEYRVGLGCYKFMHQLQNLYLSIAQQELTHAPTSQD